MEKVPDFVSRGVEYTGAKFKIAKKRSFEWDIVQDVIAKFQQLPERTDLDDIFAYFLGAIHREAARYTARWLHPRELQVDLKDDLNPAPGPTALEGLYREEEKAKARQDVDRLFDVATPQEREVLQLLRNGLSTSEIARKLGIRDAAVRMRLHFLRKRFNHNPSKGKKRVPAQTPPPAPALLEAGFVLVPSAA